MTSQALISLAVLALCLGHGLTARIANNREFLGDRANNTQPTPQVCCCKDGACSKRALARRDTFQWNTKYKYTPYKWGGLGQLAGWNGPEEEAEGKMCCKFHEKKCSMWGAASSYNQLKTKDKEWLCKGEGIPEDPKPANPIEEADPNWGEEADPNFGEVDPNDLPRSLVDLSATQNDTNSTGSHCCCKQWQCSKRALKRGDTFQWDVTRRYAKPVAGGFGQLFGQYEEEQDHPGYKCCKTMDKCSIWGSAMSYNENEDDRTWLCTGQRPPPAHPTPAQVPLPPPVYQQVPRGLPDNVEQVD